MRLQRSSALILSVTFLALGLAIILLFEFCIRNEFSRIESTRMQENVERISGALDAATDTLMASALDWGRWDDTYYFMEIFNKKYVASTLTYETLLTLGLDYIVYFKEDGALHYGLKRDSDSRIVEVVKKSAPVVRTLKKIPNVFFHDGKESKKAGYISLDGKSFLYVAVPIFDTQRLKTSKGSLIFIRDLSAAFFEGLASQTHLTLATLPVKQVARAVDIAGLQQAIKGKGSAIVLNGTAEINGYVVINNAFNEPILLIRASQYQDIYAQGTAVRNFLLIAIVLLTGAALSCVLFLFDRKVLSRLESLCSELTAITKSHDVTKRMSTTSYDEVQEISVKVNELLDDVADTQRKITDTRLEIEKTRMQSFFLARVSHELRAPIHSVTGMYRLIMKTSTNPAVRGLVRMADSTACGLLTTVNEILDFAKVESGNSLIEKIPFTVRRVAHEAMDSVLGRAEGKEKIRVVLGVDPNVPPEIIGDPTKLKQVIVYLLSNAVKFTHQGSVHLTISCDGSAAEPLLKIEVADTGIGISPEKLETIFEPFKQLDESVTRIYNGAGLGLTIAKHFTEALGGTISVKSKVGEGSTFTICLPLEIPGQCAQVLQQETQPEPLH